MDLREARFKRRLTQADLWLKTSIHPSRISLLERGYLKPREEEKAKLAKALGVRPDQLEWPHDAGMAQG